nr:relaxase/mobilization nuclease domain-containing protein [Desulfovibrio sp. 6_1_46AFAA]
MAFAGLEPDQRNILWVQHSHAGHHELHFVIPRVELSSGKAFNPCPPVGRNTLTCSATCTITGKTGPDRTTRPAPASMRRNTPTYTKPVCSDGARLLARTSAAKPSKPSMNICGSASGREPWPAARTCLRPCRRPVWKSTGPERIT